MKEESNKILNSLSISKYSLDMPEWSGDSDKCSRSSLICTKCGLIKVFTSSQWDDICDGT